MAHAAVGLGEDFIDVVLTIPQDLDLTPWTRPRIPTNPFKRLENAEQKSESEIAAEMTRVINTYGLAPGLVTAQCHSTPDSTTIDHCGQKVDSALFTEQLAPDGNQPHWADQLVPIEYKKHHTHGDPFDDNKLELEVHAQDRKKVRGQIIAYAELIFAIQQRTKLIMILIMGRKFRLLHWDRSGLSISLSIDYYERWRTLCDVFWRISVLARFRPELLGLDPSATRVFPDDPRWQRMTDAGVKRKSDVDHKPHDLAPDEITGDVVTFAYVRKLFRASLEGHWPRYELEVPDGDTVRKFLVGRPYFQAEGMTGRGTRGYVALDTQSKTGKFVWLKDAWRAHYPLLNKEGDILGRLNAAGVTNVPTLVCHGDIREQVTKTPEYWELVHIRDHTQRRPSTPSSSMSRSISAGSSKRKWTDEEANNSAPKDSSEDCPLRCHIHYRIVVEEVCLTLPFFEDGQQLVSLIYDCASAHYQATQVDIIHRDVSSGNILVLPYITTFEDGSRGVEWKGILTDWELSKDLSDPRKPRQPERIGTWQYMSKALLDCPTKVAEIPDDLESLFYVLLYHAVRYLKSNCTCVPNWLKDFFDVFSYANGAYRCGQKKRYAIDHAKLVIDSPFNKLQFNSLMDKLLRRLLQSFWAYYAVKAYDEGLKNVSRRLPQPAATPSSTVVRRRRRKVAPLPSFKPSYQPPAQRTPLVHSPNTDDKPPTDQERLLANDISYPELFLTLLREFADMEWATDDKEGDRVPADWVSTRPFGPTVFPNNTSNKRQRRMMDPRSLPNVLNVVTANSPTRRPSHPRRARSDFPG